MKHRTGFAFLLFSALLLGPVHADANADVRAGLALCDLGIDAFRSILFHNPDPRIALQHKIEELIRLDKHLVTLAYDGQLPESAKSAILRYHSSSIAIGAPNGEVTAEQVVDWQKKQLALLKQLRASLRKP